MEWQDVRGRIEAGEDRHTERSSVEPSPSELQELEHRALFGYIVTEERAVLDAPGIQRGRLRGRRVWLRRCVRLSLGARRQRPVCRIALRRRFHHVWSDRATALHRARFR